MICICIYILYYIYIYIYIILYIIYIICIFTFTQEKKIHLLFSCRKLRIIPCVNHCHSTVHNHGWSTFTFFLTLVCSTFSFFSFFSLSLYFLLSFLWMNRIEWNCFQSNLPLCRYLYSINNCFLLLFSIL